MTTVRTLHTPGPWRYLLYGSTDDFGTATRIDVTDSSKIEQPQYCVPIAVCRRVAAEGHFSFNPPNAEANARLIAAAPELLQALKLIADIGSPDYPHGAQWFPNFDGIAFSRNSPVWKAMEAAIAKAEWRQA